MLLSTVSVMAGAGNDRQSGIMKQEPLELSQEWDKTFPQGSSIGTGLRETRGSNILPLM